MKIEPENRQDLTLLVANNFRSFGGNKADMDNPITFALAHKPVSFALGVDIKEVVDFVLDYAKEYGIS